MGKRARAPESPSAVCPAPQVRRRKLSYGTACSGIGAPDVAMRRLGVDFEYKFASEIDEDARNVLSSHAADATVVAANVKGSAGRDTYVDLYVAGFPCVAFSGCGPMRAFDDSRTDAFFAISDYINAHEPSVFVSNAILNANYRLR